MYIQYCITEKNKESLNICVAYFTDADLEQEADAAVAAVRLDRAAAVPGDREDRTAVVRAVQAIITVPADIIVQDIKKVMMRVTETVMQTERLQAILLPAAVVQTTAAAAEAKAKRSVIKPSR